MAEGIISKYFSSYGRYLLVGYEELSGGIYTSTLVTGMIPSCPVRMVCGPVGIVAETTRATSVCSCQIKVESKV